MLMAGNAILINRQKRLVKGKKILTYRIILAKLVCGVIRFERFCMCVHPCECTCACVLLFIKIIQHWEVIFQWMNKSHLLFQKGNANAPENLMTNKSQRLAQMKLMLFLQANDEKKVRIMTDAYIIIFTWRCLLCLGYDESDFQSIPTIYVEEISLLDLDSLEVIYNKFSNLNQSTGAFKVWKFKVIHEFILFWFYRTY
jgi:hypothetical protein